MKMDQAKFINYGKIRTRPTLTVTFLARHFGHRGQKLTQKAQKDFFLYAV